MASYIASVKEPELVFVYGLLMRGLELHQHMRAGTFVGEGCTKGQLVSLGRYSGLVEGEGTVFGELYRFNDLPAALDILDDVEEFDATDPDGSLYLRVAARVKTRDGAEVDAWLYKYNGNVQGAPTVADGDWRTRRP